MYFLIVLKPKVVQYIYRHCCAWNTITCLNIKITQLHLFCYTRPFQNILSIIVHFRLAFDRAFYYGFLYCVCYAGSVMCSIWVQLNQECHVLDRGRSRSNIRSLCASQDILQRRKIKKTTKFTAHPKRLTHLMILHMNNTIIVKISLRFNSQSWPIKIRFKDSFKIKYAS